jgi:hypothetical protein
LFETAFLLLRLLRLLSLTQIDDLWATLTQLWWHLRRVESVEKSWDCFLDFETAFLVLRDWTTIEMWNVNWCLTIKWMMSGRWLNCDPTMIQLWLKCGCGIDVKGDTSVIHLYLLFAEL